VVVYSDCLSSVVRALAVNDSSYTLAIIITGMYSIKKSMLDITLDSTCIWCFMLLI